MTSRDLPLVRRSVFLGSILAALSQIACDGSPGEPGPDPVSPGGVFTTSATGEPSLPAGTPASTAGQALDDGSPVVAGDIRLYGVVAVGDEGGLASGDALAGFSGLSSPLGESAFGAAFNSPEGRCEITRDDGQPDFAAVSRLYLPTPDGVMLDPVDAGGTVLLSSEAGSWLELQGRPADAFYTQPFDQPVPEGAVPDTLQADITGATFPAFGAIAFPDIPPLEGFARVPTGDVTADARFSWTASGRADTRIRITTVTAGGFFLGESTRVECLVPDTGNFRFPPDVRAALGAAFAGADPDVSRLALAIRRQGDALLVLIRESFPAP